MPAIPFYEFAQDMGYTYHPHYTTGDFRIPIHHNYHGNYYYHKDKSNIIITVNAKGWELRSGKPTEDVVFLRGENYLTVDDLKEFITNPKYQTH